MIIPITSTTVINKTVVYSDTVLNLKESGRNLIVTTIYNVKESTLQECLNTIFEANKDVVFNTIQYSKNNNKVYFYTNKNISTKEWKNKNVHKYKPLTTGVEILEEIKSILTEDKTKDSDCICIYDVFNLVYNKRQEYETEKNQYDNIIRNTIKQKMNSYHFTSLHDFDFDKNELSIGYKEFGGWKEIIFSKHYNDLYVKESTTSFSNDVLFNAGDIISEAYDKAFEYKDFIKQSKNSIASTNCNFFVDIYCFGVSIKNMKDQLFPSFYLNLSSNSKKTDFKCNSGNVANAITGNEDEIFKKIFIKIEDCPKWMQESLREFRKNQLAEEQKIEDEKKYQEMKKQKRLEFKKKIFPFLYK